jgi:queuine tRNA-ribosyltransferase
MLQHFNIVFVYFQLNLMRSIHNSILEDKFPQFIRNFFSEMYPNMDYPQWAIEALESVNVKLDCTDAVS